MRKSFLIAGAVVVVMVLAGPAMAGYVMEIGDTGEVFPRERATALVPISVECPPDRGQTSSEGTSTVQLTQDQRVGVVTGSGSIPITCDNTLRNYVVPVTTPNGVFLRGPSTASGETAFPDTMCISHPELGESCEQVTMRMIVSDQPITLVYSGP